MSEIKTPLYTVIDTRDGLEADIVEIPLHEEWAIGLIYCDMEGWYMNEYGELILVDECGSLRYPPDDRYELRWNLDALKELVAILEDRR